MELGIQDLITVQLSLSISIKEIESKTPEGHLIYTSHRIMKELLEKVELEINSILYKKPGK